jgi:dolichyl-phosphate beta-glucosyltransferase
MRTLTLVVPCYNEAARLKPADFHAFMERAGLMLLFVDDGSTDSTAEVLEQLCSALNGRGTLLRMPANGGKAEAVRQGMRRALEQGAEVTGYVDADLATPPAEMLRLQDWLERKSEAVGLGARVRLLGTNIRRRPLRHYLGRIFATLASLILRLPVYDTQCGAKIFARTPALEAALAEPFLSRWAFDVELIGRLCVGTPTVPGLSPERFVEMPLRTWEDVRGSKMRLRDVVRMGSDLVRIAWDLRRRRKSAKPQAAVRP